MGDTTDFSIDVIPSKYKHNITNFNTIPRLFDKIKIKLSVWCRGLNSTQLPPKVEDPVKITQQHLSNSWYTLLRIPD